MRSHKDLDKDSAPHYHKAVKFYEALSKQLIHQGHVLDVFACALDQICQVLDLEEHKHYGTRTIKFCYFGIWTVFWGIWTVILDCILGNLNCYLDYILGNLDC
ncbi:hypothetical protein ACS0TY_000511 [Phlomoides rotata]